MSISGSGRKTSGRAYKFKILGNGFSSELELLEYRNSCFYVIMWKHRMQSQRVANQCENLDEMSTKTYL